MIELTSIHKETIKFLYNINNFLVAPYYGSQKRSQARAPASILVAEKRQVPRINIESIPHYGQRVARPDKSSFTPSGRWKV